MQRFIRSTIAVAALALAGTASAAEDPRADVRATAPAKAQNPNQKVCVRDSVTGSRIPKKMCKSRAEWRDLGFKELAEAR